mmetsp:Transcript_10818/g.26460  ORF Transcript_10818/g.26460 Transcript_10818/m.26460 type:complete len:129 (+) Transcript_10818:1249-1635(+)
MTTKQKWQCGRSIRIRILLLNKRLNKSDHSIQRRRFYGQSEGCIKINITIDRETKTLRDVGPISVRFEIPNYTPTGIEIRYLRIQPAGLHSALVSSPTSPLGAAQGEPSRWVRYVCYAGDFSCRVAAA